MRTLIGERAGNGVPNIFNVWEYEGWIEPVIEEQFAPDRMVLTLEFIKTSDKKQAIKKQAKKAVKNIDKIRKYLQNNSEAKSNNISDLIEPSSAMARVITAEMKGFII